MIVRCKECGRFIDAAPGDYCPGGECRRAYHSRLLGEDAVETRATTPPVRAQTLSVRDAETALSGVRSAEATARLHAAQEQDLMIRAALGRVD